jgi:virginiamycin B lyase
MKAVAVGLVVVLTHTALSLPANGQSFTKYRAFPGHLPGATDTPAPVCQGSPALSGIAAGPDGAVWYTDVDCNLIGRVTTAGVVTTFPIPTPNSSPTQITAGPDGALWFTEYMGGKIGRITTAGAITEFAIPTSNPIPLPLGIVLGPDGALWFTEEQGNKIGRITTSGTITEFPIPTIDSEPVGITSGPDGALWFTEQPFNKIGRITTAGNITEFVLPTAGAGPALITAGPDGALWFTESGGSKIGRITTGGMITEFPTPTASMPFGIGVGPDGALWFTEPQASNIGRITTSGAIDEFSLSPPPNTFPGPYIIITGPDGNLWFTELNAADIVTFAPPPPTSPLFAATLPSSRSAQVGGEVATAFASIINSGASAINCGIAPVTPVPANFLFQSTDPATNQLTGTPNTRVPIAAGGSQSYLVAFTPSAPFVPTNVTVGYDCDNVDAVATIIGVNTLLLTFSSTPVPDMIAVGLTPSNDGFSHTGGTGGTGVFAIAAANIGASGQLTAQVALSNSTMPLTATVCQTNPSTGQCLAPPTSSVTSTINQNQNTTWTAFLTASGTIALNPAANRVYFEFVDSGGVVRGSTSTAVTTQ